MNRHFPRFKWHWVFGFWSLFAVFLSLSFHVTANLTGRPSSFPVVFWNNLVCCLLWAMLTPLIVGLNRRAFIGGPRWYLSLALHLICSVSFVLFILAMFVLLDRFMSLFTQHSGPFIERFKELVHFMFHAEVLYYWFIVLLFHSLTYLNGKRIAEVQMHRIQQNLSEARLKVLTMQIQPHFLFNTLHTLAGLVRLDRKQDAADAIGEFGELMRFSLKLSQRTMVRVEEEIGFIENFFKLESRRFPQASFSLHLDDTCRGLYLPTLIIQPLIENAIQACRLGSRPSEVFVTLSCKGDLLQITVQDNGPGLPEGWSLTQDSGVGLMNTLQRLEAYFDDNFSLTLNNQDSLGCRAFLVIPRLESPL